MVNNATKRPTEAVDLMAQDCLEQVGKAAFEGAVKAPVKALVEACIEQKAASPFRTALKWVRDGAAVVFLFLAIPGRAGLVGPSSEPGQ